jgi:outer membrane protein OmpA-like peptidoglycan-associated protein
MLSAKLAKTASVACALLGVTDLLALNLVIGPRALQTSQVAANTVAATEAAVATWDPNVPPMATAPAPPDVAAPQAAASPHAPVDAPKVVAIFASAEAAGREQSEALEAIAAGIKGHPKRIVVLSGYTDHHGTDEFNRILSFQRAAWARQKLIALGVPASRIRVTAHGSAQPLRTGDDDESLAANRRVEARIVEK